MEVIKYRWGQGNDVKRSVRTMRRTVSRNKGPTYLSLDQTARAEKDHALRYSITEGVTIV